jgi:hypothetical protein
MEDAPFWKLLPFSYAGVRSPFDTEEVGRKTTKTWASYVPEDRVHKKQKHCNKQAVFLLGFFKGLLNCATKIFSLRPSRSIMLLALQAF